MKTFTDKFSETFGIELTDDIIEIEAEINPEPKKAVIPSITNNIIDDDTEFARAHIKNLIEKGAQAIDSILNIAEQSAHPRAFEVAANFIKNISELNKDLLEIQKRKKELTASTVTRNESNMNINKAVFIGSTKELLKLINDTNTDQLDYLDNEIPNDTTKY